MSTGAGSDLIAARGIVKRYPNVVANDHVDFAVRRGEVHALLGENGAGKSTLSKILYGFSRPDEGRIFFEGRPVELRSPHDARALGIGMVFQNFTLIPALSVLENIALFLTDLPPVFSRADITARIRGFANRFGLSVDPAIPVRELSIGDKQKVEIIKLLLADARFLILDEPTRVLVPHEVEALFRVLAALKAEGYAILFITHKLQEVLAGADRITVMRRGRVAGTMERGQADEAALVSLMFEGGAVAREQSAVRLESRERAALLELRGAGTRATGGETALRGIDLVVREGETVGVAGVSGNGQKELSDLIQGLRPLRRGVKRLFGRQASGWTIRRIRQNGVAFVPEDPLAMAAVPGMSVRENLVLGTGQRYAKGVGIDWPRLEADMRACFQRLGFQFPELDSPIRSLSGGNLQKVIIARELAHRPRLIIALYPTRGLDVRSAAAVRELLCAARDSGGGVLLISEDVEELFQMSDRLVVMFGGAIAGEYARGDYRLDAVGHLMTGSGEGHT